LDPFRKTYWLVDDIEAALAASVEAGSEVAHPPMEIPGHGTFAIYIQGGVHHGLATVGSCLDLCVRPVRQSRFVYD
jgi:hypothetical protein